MSIEALTNNEALKDILFIAKNEMQFMKTKQFYNRDGQTGWVLLENDKSRGKTTDDLRSAISDLGIFSSSNGTDNLLRLQMTEEQSLDLIRSFGDDEEALTVSNSDVLDHNVMMMGRSRVDLLKTKVVLVDLNHFNSSEDSAD